MCTTSLVEMASMCVTNNIFMDESKCSDNTQGKGSLLWRFFNFLMAVFFGLAAYVQINDPDSVTWVIIYGVPCVLCCCIVFSASLQGHIFWRGAAISHCVGCIVGALYMISTTKSLQETYFYPFELEEGRELCGLLIVIVWLMFCIIAKSFHGLNIVAWSIALIGCVAPLVSWMYYYKTMAHRNLPTHCKDML